MENNSFIPEVNSELYNEYKIRVFRMVPKNAKLICQNIFTGALSVKENGFRFILPWRRSKLVNTTKTVIDYPQEKYLTREGIYVEIDPALTVRIVDPIKFEYENTDPIQELKILVKDVIRSFVESKLANELIGRNYSIEEKDPGELFKSFEERTGLHISHLFFKNITLPKNLVDDYEKAKAQELENRRAIAEAESKKRQAEINAESKRISADAAAYSQAVMLKETIELLKSSNYDEKTISEVVKTLLISGSNNTSVIANIGNNTNNQEAAASMLISALSKIKDNKSEEVNEKPKPKTRKRVTSNENN